MAHNTLSESEPVRQEEWLQIPLNIVHTSMHQFQSVLSAIIQKFFFAQFW